MKMGEIDLGKMAFVFGMMAFQIHILTMTVSKFFVGGSDGQFDHRNSRNNVVQAFIIIAYLLYIFSVLLLLILSYSNLKGNKGLSAFTSFLLFIAASSVVIGLAVYDSQTYYGVQPGEDLFSSFTTTTYCAASLSGYISAVILLISLCA